MFLTSRQLAAGEYPCAVPHTDGDVPELGAVLELLHRGGAGFATVRATYRIWRHDDRLSAAFHVDIEERKSRGVSISTASARWSGPPRPVEREEVLRIWRDGDRIRQEHESDDWRDGAYGVRHGEVWWSWNSHSGALTNQDDPRVASSGIGEELAVMLDPAPLLGALRFAAVGRSAIAGRATLTAEATARPSDPGRALRSMAVHQLGTGADRYTLEVDVEKGVLLEAVAFRDGLPFHRITTVEIVFDHPIPEERFHFEPPGGEKIQPMSGRPRPQWLSVTEAQQRAPFTVLIPDRIPAHWRVHCMFVEASTRPPLPAQVSLQYRSDDGHESVSLSQSSATNRPPGYEGLTSGDAWQDIERNGTVVRVTKPDAVGSQAQAQLERNGTFVVLTSETLTSHQLATLAAGLKPAPDTGSV